MMPPIRRPSAESSMAQPQREKSAAQLIDEINQILTRSQGVTQSIVSGVQFSLEAMRQIVDGFQDDLDGMRTDIDALQERAGSGGALETIIASLRTRLEVAEANIGRQDMRLGVLDTVTGLARPADPTA